MKVGKMKSKTYIDDTSGDDGEDTFPKLFSVGPKVGECCVELV